MRLPPAELPDDLPVHNNLVRTTYANPDMHRGFASLSGRVHSASHLDGRGRELVILAVAGALGSDYELQQHRQAATTIGLTGDEIDAAVRGNLEFFDGRDAACVALARAVDSCTVDDALWRGCSECLEDEELRDLVMLAAFYGLASRFVLALDVDLEPDGR